MRLSPFPAGWVGPARLVDEERLTDSSIIMCPPSSMAPEQTGLAQGPELERQIAPATDIHAMGAILLASLSGRPPYPCLASDKPACRAAIVACREKLRPRGEPSL